MDERFYQSNCDPDDDTAGTLRLHYRDWPGSDQRLPVLCLHGLTRTSRDFIDFAGQLSPRRRVLAPDVRGRGCSQYDPDCDRYQPITYTHDMWELLAETDVDHVVLVGTSMGGIVAMLMAAQQPERIAGIVLNDIGPQVERTGIDRIIDYAGKPLSLASWEEAVATLKERAGDALPGLSGAQWLRYARQTFREGIDGRPEVDYDTGISRRFVTDVGVDPARVWELFEGLEVPMLLLHGTLSDVLSAETAQRMTAVNPRCTLVTVPDRGHVPLLDEPVALAAIDGFLAALP